MIYSLRRFDKDEVAKERLKIIMFYEEYGEKATVDAYGADRKVVSRWKQKLAGSKGLLASLIPMSTRPVNVRQPQTRAEIVEFIKYQREKHFRIGKDKLKIFLDVYCREQAIPTVSVSTIGNIIKRHNFFYQNLSSTQFFRQCVFHFC